MLTPPAEPFLTAPRFPLQEAVRKEKPPGLRGPGGQAGRDPPPERMRG